MKRLAMMPLLFSMSACSFAFVHGPAGQSPPPLEAMECTDSNTLPYLDIITGSAMVGLSGFLYWVEGLDWFGAGTRRNYANISLVGGIGVAQLVAGFQGRGKVRRCREAMEAMTGHEDSDPLPIHRGGVGAAWIPWPAEAGEVSDHGTGSSPTSAEP